jgi:hypothetical protein
MPEAGLHIVSIEAAAEDSELCDSLLAGWYQQLRSVFIRFDFCGTKAHPARAYI